MSHLYNNFAEWHRNAWSMGWLKPLFHRERNRIPDRDVDIVLYRIKSCHSIDYPE